MPDKEKLNGIFEFLKEVMHDDEQIIDLLARAPTYNAKRLQYTVYNELC